MLRNWYLTFPPLEANVYNLKAPRTPARNIKFQITFHRETIFPARMHDVANAKIPFNDPFFLPCIEGKRR